MWVTHLQKTGLRPLSERIVIVSDVAAINKLVGTFLPTLQSTPRTFACKQLGRRPVRKILQKLY